MRFLLAAAVVLAAPFSCRRPARTAAVDGAGTIDIQWTGSAKGKFVAPAAGQWCPADSLLELTAIRGDTGVAIALVAQDTIRIGQHPVVIPAVPVGWRPHARAAVRWIGKAETQGFEGVSGNVHVTEVVANTVSGRVDARMQTGNRRDTLRLVGTFTKVRFRPNPAPCGRTVKGGAG